MEVQCVQDYNDILIGTVRSMYVAPRSSTKGQQYSWWDKETVEKMEEPEEDVHELIRESIRWQMDLVEQLGPLTDHLGKGVKDADSVDAVVNLCLKLPKSIVCRLQLIRFLANTTEPSAYEAVKRDKRMAEALFSWCSAAAMDKVTTILAEGLALIHSLDFFPRLLHAEWQRRLIEDWMDHIDFRVRRAAEDNLWKKS